MSGLLRSLWVALAILVVVPLVALCDLTPAQRAENLRKVAQWRADPARYAQLRASARAFLQLPVPRQEEILTLDHDLYALAGPARIHLLGVARRYADWLAGLPESQRRKIAELPDGPGRLQVVRQLREQELLQGLPHTLRVKVEKSKGKERAELLEEFLRLQRLRSRRWQIALQHWDELIKKQPVPAALGDFPPDVQAYVKEYLRPVLSPQERARLDKAEGRWPVYPYMLVMLADKHPMALPGTHGPTHFKELPVEVQARLAAKLKKPGYAALKKVEGKWPEFAQIVTLLVRNHPSLRLPYEFWPSRREDLSAPVAVFLEKKLLPALSDEEKGRLKEAERRWPLYPWTIKDLALRHDLQVPWQTLPGPREQWEKYRFRATRPPGPALVKP